MRKCMSRYEVLIFDADETLFDYTRGQAYALEKSLTKVGIVFDPIGHIDLYKHINDRLWKELEDGKIDRAALRNERFKLVLDEIGCTSADPAAVSDDYLNELGNAGFMIDGAIVLLEELHKHFRLALLTNGFSQVQHGRIARTNTAVFFDAIVISEEVGCQKPQREIFDLLLDELGHENRRNVLMIGDSLSSDITGGVNAGVDTCWYNPEGIQCPAEIVPTYIVDDYDGIRKIVLG